VAAAWKSLLVLEDVEHALVMGVAGTLASATAADQADFLIFVPFDMTLKRLKASVKVAPSSSTTFQIRRSTDSGGTFSNAFGTVVISSSAKVGVADPADLNVDEGDLLNFSITVGGGSGENAAIHVLGVQR